MEINIGLIVGLVVYAVNILFPAIMAAWKGYNFRLWLLYGLVPLVPILHISLLPHLNDISDSLSSDGAQPAPGGETEGLTKKISDGVKRALGRKSLAKQRQLQPQEQKITIKKHEGIEIVRKIGRDLKFKYKCPLCGAMDSIPRTVILAYNAKATGKIRCGRCGSEYEWRIVTGKR